MSPSLPRGQAMTFNAFSASQDVHGIEHLHDGSHVLIRPLRQEDRRRETEFIRRLPTEARRLRFLGEFHEQSPTLIDQPMTVDGDRAAAFVALVHDSGTLREIGIGRYGATSNARL